jgi:hypothetical protein
MERRLVSSFAILVLMLAMVGCGSNTSTDPAASNSAAAGSADSASNSPTANAVPNSATFADPAAQVANTFLEAVVKGDTAQASSLLTPLAIERINASGKPFQLPGLANYTFRVGDVSRPAPDKAFVQCVGTDSSAKEQTVNEEFCWLMSLVEDQWRIAGISYTAGPQKTLMIYSFENPEKGAIPVQSLMAQSAGQTAAAPGAQQAPAAQAQPAGYPAETPRTAQEALPTGAYR